MMSNFDTADYARQLELGGLPKSQAKAHAQALAKVIDKLTQEAQLLTLQYNLQTETHRSELRLLEHVTTARKTLSAEIASQNTRIDALQSFLDLKLGQRGLLSPDYRNLYFGVLLGISLSMLTKMIFFLLLTWWLHMRMNMPFARSSCSLRRSTIQAMYLHVPLNRIPRTGD